MHHNQNFYSNMNINGNGPNIIYQKHQHQPQLQYQQHQSVVFNSLSQETSSSVTLPPLPIYDEKFMFQPNNNNAFLFNEVNRPTPMLDNGPSKFKSMLIKRGSLATRQLPLQQQVQVNQFKKIIFPDQER